MGVEVDYDITGALITPPTGIPTAFLGGGRDAMAVLSGDGSSF